MTIYSSELVGLDRYGFEALGFCGADGSCAYLVKPAPSEIKNLFPPNSARVIDTDYTSYADGILLSVKAKKQVYRQIFW